MLCLCGWPDSKTSEYFSFYFKSQQQFLIRVRRALFLHGILCVLVLMLRFVFQNHDPGMNKPGNVEQQGEKDGHKDRFVSAADADADGQRRKYHRHEHEQKVATCHSAAHFELLYDVRSSLDQSKPTDRLGQRPRLLLFLDSRRGSGLARRFSAASFGFSAGCNLKLHYDSG